MFSTVNKGGNHPESSAFGALTQIAVPENYPTVPVIPLYRNPVFPKFVKLVEVNGELYHLKKIFRVVNTLAAAFLIYMMQSKDELQFLSG